MTLEEVLRDEAIRRGYPENVLEACMTFARCLVLAGRSEFLDRELSEREEAVVRLEFAIAEGRNEHWAERLVGRN
jgi:hypothetical protein